MISTEELINWAKNCHKNICIHAFDARYKTFLKQREGQTINLVDIVKDHHLYTRTDEKLKIVTSEANQGGCRDLFKYMIELKWPNVMLTFSK